MAGGLQNARPTGSRNIYFFVTNLLRAKGRFHSIVLSTSAGGVPQADIGAAATASGEPEPAGTAES